jgi:ADP-ribose pyrophosphatase YjhB (NUDIX family)
MTLADPDRALRDADAKFVEWMRTKLTGARDILAHVGIYATDVERLLVFAERALAGPAHPDAPGALTPQQAVVLRWIASYIDSHGYAPSFTDIAAGLGYSSLATVGQHVTNLVNKGWLARDANKMRSLQVLVPLPDEPNGEPVDDYLRRLRDPLLHYFGTTDPELLVEVWAQQARPTHAPQAVHGVTWLLIRDGHVLLERCPKKAAVLGVGEWFVPGGKIDGLETPEAACRRELHEEWPGVELVALTPLPLVEGSRVPPGPAGVFMMRPFVISVTGELPTHSADGPALRWVPLEEALTSPVPQVRMMVGAAFIGGHTRDSTAAR